MHPQHFTCTARGRCWGLTQFFLEQFSWTLPHPVRHRMLTWALPLSHQMSCCKSPHCISVLQRVLSSTDKMVMEEESRRAHGVIPGAVLWWVRSCTQWFPPAWDIPAILWFFPCPATWTEWQHRGTCWEFIMQFNCLKIAIKKDNYCK